MSILQGSKDFFPLFLLAAAKSALSILTVKISCSSDLAQRLEI